MILELSTESEADGLTEVDDLVEAGVDIALPVLLRAALPLVVCVTTAAHISLILT